MKMVLFHEAYKCIHQITLGKANTVITYACWYAREHPDSLLVVNCQKVVNKCQIL